MDPRTPEVPERLRRTWAEPSRAPRERPGPRRPTGRWPRRNAHAGPHGTALLPKVLLILLARAARRFARRRRPAPMYHWVFVPLLLQNGARTCDASVVRFCAFAPHSNSVVLREREVGPADAPGPQHRKPLFELSRARRTARHRAVDGERDAAAPSPGLPVFARAVADDLQLRADGAAGRPSARRSPRLRGGRARAHTPHRMRRAAPAVAVGGVTRDRPSRPPASRGSRRCACRSPSPLAPVRQSVSRRAAERTIHVGVATVRQAHRMRSRRC